MAFTKAHRFNPRDYYYSLLCHAFAHPARICILRKLIREGDKCPVKTLSQGLPLSNSTVSQHLKVLRDLSIVCCEQKYPTVYYWINKDLPCMRETLFFLLSGISTNKMQNSLLEVKAISRYQNLEVEGV